MSNILSEKLKKILLTVLVVFFCISFQFGVSGGVHAAAETGESVSSIMSELCDMTVDGKDFDPADYPANKEKTLEILFLIEYGYGAAEENRAAFGINLYVYNPAQLNIKEDVRNTVQMKIGSAERYSKYNLRVIESSADKLFYKLGVAFKGDEKTSALSVLDKDSREYEVSSIEFYIWGFNATDFPASRAFTYTGYAAEFGESGENTLTCKASGGTVPISLEVNHTSWRPEGTNGNSEYTQDTIHSVYFAVPKELDEKYDYLKSVQARWLEARLAPILVTDDKEAYDSVIDLQRKNAELTTEAPAKFALSGDGWAYTWAFGVFNSAYGRLILDKGFGFDTSKAFRYYVEYLPISVSKTLSTLYLAKFTGGTSANSYVVTSSELTEMIQNEANNGLFNNDKKVAGKYPSYLFDSYDTEFTTQVITVGEFDKSLNLHSEEVKRNLWQQIFGGYSTDNQQDYTEIEAIKVVTEDDVADENAISEKLYISPRDVEDFKTYYENNKADSTIYLLRFAVSEYQAETVRTYKQNKYSGVWAYDYRSNSGGYIAQETCYLDFDIIDFEYVKGKESYVIPVSMSPIDIFPELTPPPQYPEDFWKYGLAIMAGLTVAYVAYKIACKAVRR